ncbi:MAG: site-specific DNA-methyltransferase, partial [Bacteroidota bacterium]
MIIYPNSLIKSDALVLLERLDDQSVDLVYLDPPWFTMGDDPSVSKDQYKNFIYKVLQQVQRVLKRTGNVFMYSRPDLNLDFGMLLGEVFGVENYVAEFVIPVKRHTNRGTESVHETLFFYRLSEEHVNNRLYKNSMEDIRRLFPKEDEKGLYAYLSLFGRAMSSRSNFEWNGITPPDGLTWRYSKDKLDTMLANELIEKKQDYLYEKKYYTSEEQLFPIGSIWDDIPFIPAGRRPKGSQNVKLLERIIRIGSQEDQIVLDVFCCSGPSIDACINLKRGFIACDNSSNAIASCIERIKDTHPDVGYSFLEEGDVLSMPVVWDNYQYAREEDELVDIISKGENAFVEF